MDEYDEYALNSKGYSVKKLPFVTELYFVKEAAYLQKL
jgi:hypothetical protein